MTAHGTAGYVVLHCGQVASLGDANVLWIPCGRVPLATLFGSLKAARRAIERTKAYAVRHGYNWATDYRVVRLRSSSEDHR